MVAQIFAGFAAFFHVVFFIFESVLFKDPKIQKRFHIAPEAGEAVRPWAFNQGFYNLFLALGVVAGLLAMHGVLPFDASSARMLVVFPCVCMIGAGLVLAATDRRMLRSAAIQAVPPAIAIILLFV